MPAEHDIQKVGSTCLSQLSPCGFVKLSSFKLWLYKWFMLSIRAYQRLFLDLHVWGHDRIPSGPKIYIYNHASSSDGLWPMPVFTEFVHAVIGPLFKLRLVGRILDAFQQINAMPEHRHECVDKAVHYLMNGDSVLIVPEGDIQEPFQLGKFYSGAARIYRKTRIPIVPIAIAAPKHAMRERGAGIEVEGRIYRTVTVLRGPYCINVGDPFTPDIPAAMSDREQDETITAQIKDRIQTLLDEIRDRKYWSEPAVGRFRSGWLKARAGRTR